MVVNRIAEILTLYQVFIYRIENYSYQVRNVYDDECQHNYPVQNTHRLVCIYSGIYHTQQVVHLQYLHRIHHMKPSSDRIRYHETYCKHDEQNDIDKIEIVTTDVFDVEHSF